MYLGDYQYVCGLCKNYDTEKCEWCGENRNFVPTNDPVPEDMSENLAKLRFYYEKAVESK